MTGLIAPHRATLAEIVAALLLPPLGVFLARGLGLGFWIALVLTALFWVPGILFSLALVLRPDFLPGR